ncbi:hypothetical protein AMV125 [Betaentomopoxvirus amoorei]|uniref:AMV125 n=1 Tax=Amsacta moorei entomopoxvirus TaxID=28321 RepID=Q9EMS4_AMEPV|nr:hypothetical protein AMV125 [Amsacta moorei entomopoxvirus]AAG02831.1 AMV125 [Amsacta moorei entomopoxvirus]
MSKSDLLILYSILKSLIFPRFIKTLYENSDAENNISLGVLKLLFCIFNIFRWILCKKYLL